MHRKNRRPLNAMEISERVRHKMALLHFLSMSVILFICDIAVYMLYESIATVGESRVGWRADFQSGSRVSKKVFWTFSYLYLWHTM